MISFKTHPSLALIKYWGKDDNKMKNIPASSSLAISLDTLETQSRLEVSPYKLDTVIINDIKQNDIKYKVYFNEIRKRFEKNIFFNVNSKNNFPISAGLASSSSGFASLAILTAYTMGLEIKNNLKELSALARIGSGSAARAVYGGVTIFPKGSQYAMQIYDNNHFKDLRVLIAITENSKKNISSRDAMNLAKQTSPYFNSWIENSQIVYLEALEAFEKKDFQKLGELIRLSYLRMFSTMFSSSPGIIYWNEKSIAIIKIAEELRKQKIFAYETMDAGPQVKIICLKNDLKKIKEEIKNRIPGLVLLESKIAKNYDYKIKEIND